MHNYKNDYKGKRAEVHPVDEAATVEETEIIEETAEALTEAESIDTTSQGVVCGCKNLRIRSSAKAVTDANVIGTLSEGCKVIIDEGNSTAEWVSVCTESGVTGFCMRKFVKTES